MKIACLLFVLCAVCTSQAQNQSNAIDVLNYALTLELSDSHDTIFGTQNATVNFKTDSNTFCLDLASVNNGKGMKVTAVTTTTGKDARFTHEANQLCISRATADATGTYIIHYKGIPKTGLIIGKNKFNERTFFGDNWPNRAHQWFPCLDHPADKASIQFTVIAPSNYKCIATGVLKDAQTFQNGTTRHTFTSKIQLPTKVMVIGLADFETKQLEHTLNFPVDIWAYKKDAENGFKDMAVATNVVDYFVATIGPYPFEQLSNVQSTTQFGGMENAGNIFYDENAVNGQQEMEALIAHEIAHQWFGNSASESDWKHLWLSEGFATYFTDLYFENQYGTAAMNERLKGERKKVIQFSKRYPHPVIDTTYASLMHLLNPHSYQKGAWVLHMLRTTIGDSAFFSGIRTYYTTYKFGNASSNDFQKCMQTSAGKDLTTFFDQWLRNAHHPELKIELNTTNKNQLLTIVQLQDQHPFNVELEIEFTYTDQTTAIKQFTIDKKVQQFQLPQKKIKTINCDPNTKLLAEINTL